jgi:hypothetical protein
MEDYRKNPYFRKMDIDVLFQSTWDLYKKYFGWFFFYSFIVVVLMQYASSSLLEPYFENIQNLSTDPGLASEIIKQAMLLFLITIVAYTLLYMFFTYIILHPEDETASRQMLLLGEAIKKHYLPLLGTTLLASAIVLLGTMLGVFVLIIGSFIAAIYLGSVLFIIIPLTIVENTRPTESVSRCFKLVHTDLWKTMGWVLIFFVLFFVVSMIISIVTMIPFAGNLLEMIKDPAASMGAGNGNILNNPIQFLLTSAGNALLMPFMPIFSTLIYLNLKFGENPGIEQKDEFNIMEHFR